MLKLLHDFFVEKIPRYRGILTIINSNEFTTIQIVLTTNVSHFIVEIVILHY